MRASEEDRLAQALDKNLHQLLEGEIDKIEKESGAWKLVAYRIKGGINPPLVRIDIQPKVEKGVEDES